MKEVNEAEGAIGVLCALPEELGDWAGRGEVIPCGGGVEVRRVIESGLEVHTCVSGVGKVRAAIATESLLNSGVRKALLFVGTCGSLSRDIRPGMLVHCREAVQADLSPELCVGAHPDPHLLGHWLKAVPGPVAGYLTADRPVMSPWMRWKAKSRTSGPCVADMETAAAGAVAGAWGVPWAALRAVTDLAGWGSHKAFRKRYPVEAGRAADTVRGLLSLIRV